MKALKFLFMVLITLLFVNCATLNSKGLHSSNYSTKQPHIKTSSVNSQGLYGSKGVSMK